MASPVGTFRSKLWKVRLRKPFASPMMSHAFLIGSLIEKAMVEALFASSSGEFAACLAEVQADRPSSEKLRLGSMECGLHGIRKLRKVYES